MKDVGVGFWPESGDKLFEAFYTTKEDELGIGLFGRRSINEARRGHLWAVPNDGPRTTFSFSIPCSSGLGADYRTARSFRLEIRFAQPAVFVLGAAADNASRERRDL